MTRPVKEYDAFASLIVGADLAKSRSRLHAEHRFKRICTDAGIDAMAVAGQTYASAASTLKEAIRSSNQKISWTRRGKVAKRAGGAK
jgi:hypothetical protein